MANPKKSVSPAYQKFVERFSKAHDDLVEGSLFGMACMKAGGKAFAGSYDGGLVVRLDPENSAKALKVSGAEPFDPSGRGKPMKGWVVLPASAKRRWATFARAALEQVS